MYWLSLNGPNLQNDAYSKRSVTEIRFGDRITEIALAVWLTVYVWVMGYQQAVKKV